MKTNAISHPHRKTLFRACSSLWKRIGFMGSTAVLAALIPAAHADTTISSDLTVSYDTWINIGSNTLTVNNPGDPVPTLTIAGGLVINGTANIGYTGNGAVNITSGTWNSSRAIYFGNQGTGNLTMSGGMITDYGVFLGVYGGTATATVTGGTWNTLSNGIFILGNSGMGTLNLAGGTISTGTMLIANNAGSKGTLNLGTGGTAGTLNATFITGGSGTATVNFNHTGDYTFASNLTGNLTVNQLGSGTTTLTGTSRYTGTTAIDTGGLVIRGSLSNSSYFFVGNSGTGTLKIDGGSVTDTYGIIGNQIGSSGTATVTGGTWANSAELQVGVYGTGMLTINGGLVTDVYGIIGVLDGNGTVTVTDGTWANSSFLNVGHGSTGTLNLCDSGVVSVGSGTGTLNLGLYQGSVGTLNLGTGGTAGTLQAAIITGGSGSATVNFNHTGDYTLASNLTGNLTVNQLGSGTTTLTGTSSYTGNTTVDGGGLVVKGSLKSSAPLSVGNSGTGTLTIDGGSVSNTYAIIGNQNGSDGTATVTSGTWANSGNLYVGNYGTGTLTINGGAVIDFIGAIGIQNGSSGTVTVTGGTWANKGDLFVGESGTGSLIINGGAVIDSYAYISGGQNSNGTVTVTGGTWANSGDLYVSYSGAGALNINGGSVTNGNAFIGSQKDSNGTVTVTGGTWTNSTNLFVGGSGTGTLTINGGSVTDPYAFIGTQEDSIGTVTVTSGTWTNSSGLYVGNYGTGVLNLTGSGVVSASSGTGTLNLALNQGSVGTLNLGTGGAAGTLQVAAVTGGSGTAVVNFNHTGGYTFDPKLTGNLSVNQLSGTTDLTGTSVYTGPTTVEGGALLVNGAITTGSVAVLNGGLLGGGGTIYSNVVNSGIVSPGNSPGTLTISGNYTQTSTGTLLIQVESLTHFDHLNVIDTATLSGKLQVDFLDGYTPVYGDVFNFLTASLVTGTFSEIDTNRLIKLKADYLSSSASFTLKAIQGLVADVPGLTPNQRAVASGLDKVVDDPRVSKLFTYLDGLTLSEIPQNLEKVVPTNLIPMFDASIATAQTQALNLERRMEEIRSGAAGFSASGLHLSDFHGTRSANGTPDGKQVIDKNGKALEPAPIDDRWGFFINGSGEFVDEESTATASGMDFTTGGITTGADYRLGDHAAVGITAGYANTSADGQVKIDSGKLGLYGTVFDGGFFLNGVVGGGLNSYDTHRDSLGGQARGDTNGTDFNALLGTGYTYRQGGFSFGPIASARYCWVGIDGFTEQGSMAPLNLNEQSEASLKSTAGLQTSYAFQLGKTTLTPQVRAQWQHEYLDASRGIGASFLPGGSFTVYGPEMGRDSLLLDVGTTVQLTRTVGVYLFYTGDLGGTNYTSHAVNGGVQVSF